MGSNIRATWIKVEALPGSCSYCSAREDVIEVGSPYPIGHVSVRLCFSCAVELKRDLIELTKGKGKVKRGR